MFHFVFTFFKKKTDMCGIEIVFIVAVSHLGAAGFCIYQVNSEKKVGHHSEIKSESPCKKRIQKVLFERW